MATKTRCGKRRYRTELEAKIALAGVQRRRETRHDTGKEERRYYRCPACAGYHLTAKGGKPPC